MPGSHEMPAEIGDVSLGTSTRRINSLEIQGQMHDFQAPRSIPQPGVPYQSVSEREACPA
jgi:hypothetical protein